MPDDAQKSKGQETSTPAEPREPKVGPQLKARRQSLRLSLAQVELDTKIRGKYLTALEAGDYVSLPNDIYSRGFVQHYANHLGLDGKKVAADYAQERGGVAPGATRAPQLDRPKRLVFTGRIVAVMVGAVVVVTVLGYLLWQLTSLAAAPNLSVTSPDVDEVISGDVTTVSGHTTPGTDVSVDGTPVLTDMNGNFSEKVALQNGVNAIRIVSASKLGKSTTVVRNVLAKLPPVDAAEATVPAATFNGVAVAVKVSETTSIIVTVDGVQSFAGTFVAGKSVVYTGKTDIKLTTGNAGATSVTVTNNVVANKTIPKLGSEGEIRRDQDFAVSTVIP
jgi:cytoskeletal protein RodZ